MSNFQVFFSAVCLEGGPGKHIVLMKRDLEELRVCILSILPDFFSLVQRVFLGPPLTKIYTIIEIVTLTGPATLILRKWTQHNNLLFSKQYIQLHSFPKFQNKSLPSNLKIFIHLFSSASFLSNLIKSDSLTKLVSFPDSITLGTPAGFS